MKSYSIKNPPIKVLGVPFFDETKKLTRLPDEVIKKVPSLSFLGRRCPGGRVCFRTNSKRFTVKIRLETLSVDVGMSIYSCQSAFVFAGEKTASRYLGLVNPGNYFAKEFEHTFEKSGEMEDITILLPRNEIIDTIDILIEDDADIAEPTPYKYSKPILYYGSSITEGGISCNPSSAYNAIISRHLDVDYYNFGFSGNAKGELDMADYINTIDFSVFVYDYDHNAPTVEHLKATHEPFFKRIREKNPSVPVVMMTRPFAVYGDDEKARRDVVKATYDNAVSAGDKNVYFIDGESFFKDFADRELCFIDTIHPNDLGFYKMAEIVEPVIKAILEKTQAQ
ncbi:MAG: hypothetical protein IJZ93_03060 [Clostridia bacterium]|nr:hypothetical protein [Clostridia bacterium]